MERQGKWTHCHQENWAEGWVYPRDMTPSHPHPQVTQLTISWKDSRKTGVSDTGKISWRGTWGGAQSPKRQGHTATPDCSVYELGAV